jgi:hypothetical protein
MGGVWGGFGCCAPRYRRPFPQPSGSGRRPLRPAGRGLRHGVYGGGRFVDRRLVSFLGVKWLGGRAGVGVWVFVDGSRVVPSGLVVLVSFKR